jgi:probable DNA metabolism protein
MIWLPPKGFSWKKPPDELGKRGICSASNELADGSLYAQIKPTCDILILVADHFSERFNSFDFAIHDVGRGSAIVHQHHGAWTLSENFKVLGKTATHGKALPLSNREIKLLGFLWLYFDTIAIEEQKNEALQRNRMPKKYWNYLTEKKREEK